MEAFAGPCTGVEGRLHPLRVRFEMAAQYDVADPKKNRPHVSSLTITDVPGAVQWLGRQCEEISQGVAKWGGKARWQNKSSILPPLKVDKSRVANSTFCFLVLREDSCWRRLRMPLEQIFRLSTFDSAKADILQYIKEKCCDFVHVFT